MGRKYAVAREKFHEREKKVFGMSRAGIRAFVVMVEIVQLSFLFMVTAAGLAVQNHGMVVANEAVNLKTVSLDGISIEMVSGSQCVSDGRFIAARVQCCLDQSCICVCNSR